MSLIDIRPALPADVTDIQACAQLAFAKYIQRIGRKPAPMHADTAGLSVGLLQTDSRATTAMPTSS